MGEYEDSERRRESAKNSLERYMHYYERWARGRSPHVPRSRTDFSSFRTNFQLGLWRLVMMHPGDCMQAIARAVLSVCSCVSLRGLAQAAHGAAHKKALEDLREMTEQRLHKCADASSFTWSWMAASARFCTPCAFFVPFSRAMLPVRAHPPPDTFPLSAAQSSERYSRLGDLQNTPASQLKFVSEAMSQISECRRILKWTYAFGFYTMTDEDAKKRFFEYTQGEAEMHLERLSEAVEGERELQRFFQSPAPAGEFNDFRGRMAGLTAVTRKFFFTLVSVREINAFNVRNG